MFRMQKTGRIAPCHARDVRASKIGLGFEKLDRDVFDPANAYDSVAALGVKWVRIQSGWARTEKKKGVFDFAWLDAIVDNLIARGLRPWMCLCYGNGLYDEAAAKVFGAVGCPPIKTEEQKAAWHRYVATVAARYAGRVTHFEVWNEPDGDWCWKHGANGREYGEFALATAAAVREGNPQAHTIMGSMCRQNMAWLSDVARTGALADAWGFTYHEYTTDETSNPERVRILRAYLEKFNPRIRIIQGESGSQSRPDGAGALRGMAWTEEKQAKQLLRHTVSDLLCEVEFMSYFSCVDMIEALNGTVGDKASYLDYGYFGVLGATFDADGRGTGTYTPKPSYHALRNLAAVFRENPAVANLPVRCAGEVSALMGNASESNFRQLTMGGFARPDGSAAFVYWKPSPLLTATVSETATFECAGLCGEPRLADPMTGLVYAIPDALREARTADCLVLRHLPLRDYPLFVFFGDFCGVVPVLADA